jgi:hypothetical protein
VLEKKAPSRIFGPKRDEMKVNWRKLHNEELHNSYSSSNRIRMMNSTRLRWGKNIERMGRRGMCVGFWWGN